MTGPRALVFDLQGTLVDFYEPVRRMGAAANAAAGLALDWQALSARWRELYREGMDAVISGRAPWRRVDRITRDALDRLLDESGCGERFAPSERDAMNAVWTRLDPWPDSVAGLARLRRRFTLATLSNAGMAAAIAVVKHAALPFDAVLSAELAHAYKPDPAVYRLAVDNLDMPPAALMMVACHPYDLRAAKALGLQTAFLARPLEFGPPPPGAPPDGAPSPDDDPAFDLCVRDLHELADRLGA